MRIRLAVPAAVAAAALMLASCGDEPAETESGTGALAGDTDDSTEDSTGDSTGDSMDDDGAGGMDDSGEPTDGADSDNRADDEGADSANDDTDGDVAADVAARLDFTATTLDGEAFDGVSLAGKPSVLWFWAPWCPKCIAEAPDVAELADTYGDEVNVVGVAGLDEEPAMQAFVSDHEVEGFTHLSDQDGVVWRHFGVTQQSVFVLLDADGNPQHSGALSPDELNNRVAELAS